MREHYHFIGIGGMGMGPLASLMLAKGYGISGSDIKETPVIARLREQGGRIVIGHDSRNINGADRVVYSSAIRDENPEMVFARSKRIPLLKRAQCLAELMEDYIGITVAGAHGKTTTTSMIAQLLIKAGLSPTTAVGGIINGDVLSDSLGRGRYFVAEVDESDGSFLYFKPRYSVITNIDFEHVDYYHNWDNILNAYERFIDRTDPSGLVIACGDDARLKKILNKSRHNHVTYGFLPENDVVAQDARKMPGQDYSEQFECFVRGENLGTIQLPVPGRHNILNALACICVGLNLSLDFSVIQEGLKSYRGIKRRFQLIGDIDHVTIIDDYGHHPAEITATLKTARAIKENRVITVFQPHRYSRTKFLMDEFVKALLSADYLIVTDIYAAGEPVIKDVSAKDLCERIRAEKTDVVYLKKEKIVEHLLEIVKPGDMVLTLGAGDIHSVAEDFLRALKNKKKGALR